MAFTVTVIDRNDLDREAGRASDGCGTACPGCGPSGVIKGEADVAASAELSPLED